MKAVLQYRASPEFARRLAAVAPDWLQVTIVEEVDKARFAREMHDTDVLLHALEPVTAEVIANAPRLKLIQKIGVGVNTIDLKAAAAAGVKVANMPGTNSQAVAEMTLALLFAVLRRIVFLDAQTRQGQGWTLPLDALDRVGEIAGRTVGLVGFGEIPQRLLPVFEALGATVVYTARTRRPDARARWCSLDELLTVSDIVSLHVPLTEQTRHMLNGDSFASFKRGSILINTARGGLVDEIALARALRDGPLAGAGLDVMASEPLPAHDGLTSLPNVVLAPHVAWLTPETLDRSLIVAMENCKRLRAGQPLLNEIRI
jgi:phosphoglycerate dehydrogenase-like enzyme